ncbi:MAG: hypothetical protein C0626_05065 [Arcobacter sp.]|uniref:hypothetical protein n=1 Tax=uncultured Arcobacter sp. TaxID=165434 RepID=UPI000CC14C3A|nr:hypothetical protein [uncultured Arcobacter sp.]PLY10356.1 MAG: hypothetical protein C0626_05065 [Arcobacter sp.]
MKILIIFILLLVNITLFADQYVNGYYKSNGTYVKGYYRSSPNGTKSDNFSTYGNTNPYTGEKGTKKYNNYGYGNSSKKN